MAAVPVSPPQATARARPPSAVATCGASAVLPTRRPHQAEQRGWKARVRQTHGDVVDHTLLHRAVRRMPCVEDLPGLRQVERRDDTPMSRAGSAGTRALRHVPDRLSPTPTAARGPPAPERARRAAALELRAVRAGSRARRRGRRPARSETRPPAAPSRARGPARRRRSRGPAPPCGRSPAGSGRAGGPPCSLVYSRMIRQQAPRVNRTGVPPARRPGSAPRSGATR